MAFRMLSYRSQAKLDSAARGMHMLSRRYGLSSKTQQLSRVWHLSSMRKYTSVIFKPGMRSFLSFAMFSTADSCSDDCKSAEEVVALITKLFPPSDQRDTTWAPTLRVLEMKVCSGLIACNFQSGHAQRCMCV